MSYQVITCQELVEILRQEPARITWVIGAGMSVSSGIPLAVGVGDRLRVYEDT